MSLKRIKTAVNSVVRPLVNDKQSPLEERPLILGIDPGYKGALALYDVCAGALIEVMDMPINSYMGPDGRQKTEIKMMDLALFLDLNRDLIRGAIIEEVGAQPKDGKVSAFNFGKSTGILHGVIAANMIPIFSIRPAVWKTNMGLSADKNLSIQKAKVLFPNHTTLFLRKKDDGRAEAALLAKYGERIFGAKKEHLI